MKRVVDFWVKYRPQADPAALEFLESDSIIVSYHKDEIIKLPDQHFPYFCVVLEGVVGGYSLNWQGQPLLRELILPLDYFTGTIHLFSNRNLLTEYRALMPVQLLQIPIARAVHGQQHYPDIAELFHVMKQRKLNIQRYQVLIYQQTNAYNRYVLYRTYFPDWAHQLPHRIQY
ncbi:MAG TPA: hypothetical protein VFD72_05160, partial [Sphingobacteriaceae bacterium]|nr:hypothetical protein [Sphingobacteriaceae bacterium]